MRSNEGRDRYLVEIISYIGERVTSKADETDGFSKCHGVCGNINCGVSFVTNLLVFLAINAGKFRLNMNFFFPSQKRQYGEAICFHSSIPAIVNRT